MRVVLDTNVLIAAFATHGICHLILESVLTHHELILSPELFREIESVLKRKLKVPNAKRQQIIRFLKDQSILFEDRTISALSCRDPDDLKVLALAIQGNANFLVTGDDDLLILKKVRKIPIISPREFWDRLRH